jgi:hypothetical protein
MISDLPFLAHRWTRGTIHLGDISLDSSTPPVPWMRRFYLHKGELEGTALPMGERSSPYFVKALWTPNKVDLNPGTRSSLMRITFRANLCCQPYEPQDQDSNNLPQTTRTITNTSSIVGAPDGLSNLDKKQASPESPVGSRLFGSMGESSHANSSLGNEVQTPESPSTEIPPSAVPAMEAPNRGENGNIGTANAERLEKWNGQQFEFDIIEDRYEIDWENPLGRSENGEVLKVERQDQKFVLMTSRLET